MAKIEIPAQIRTEDYPEEYSELIDKLAGIYNPFIDDITRAINGRLDYENLARQLVTLDLRTNASGVVVNAPQVKYNLNSKIKGIVTLSATNLVNSGIYPLSTPFISWTINGQFITILNVSGLQADSQYRLTIELIS